MTFFSLMGVIMVISTVCPCKHNSNDCGTLNLIQDSLTWCTLSWFGHSFVSDWVFTIGLDISKCQQTMCKYLSSLKFVIS